MIKVFLQIKENKLFFSIRKRLNTEQKNLINTNVISQNELVFSDEYIKKNAKLVHNFLKELVSDYKIDTIVIKEMEIAPLILHVCTNIQKIINLHLLEESIITYKVCEKIIKQNTIKYVSLYNIPTFLLEMLDKEKIIVESRNEILFLSNFMKINNLDTFSSLYYKTSIKLDLPLKKDDEEDFISFMNINKYLKTIYVNKLNKNDIENILEILYSFKAKNLRIYIKENINNIELIEYLKKINKKNSKINNIQFKIDYSKEYLEDNLINQISLNTIKICIILCLFLISSLVFYVFYSNYSSMQKVDDIKDDINKIIEEQKKEIVIKPPDTTTPVEDEPINEPEEKKKEITNMEVASLLEINKDIVGWLKVKNTNVDYPVVQANDNDYYLSRNLKKQKDPSGWIFLDYRVDKVNLNQNNIIFGHNMYYSGVMFGTLYKVNSSNWYKNEENQIIEFDTLYGKMKWKIFSIYKINVTNDYLITNFSTDEKYQNFIDMITDRSIYTFNTPVSTKDKILTLSTCSNNGTKRLVIHAVLLSD